MMLNRNNLTYIINETIENILNEGRNEEKARMATIEVVKQHFNNAEWLNDVYNDPSNTRGLTVTEYIENKLKTDFFHSNIPDAVIRLEPFIMKIALSFNFQWNNPDTRHLNRLAKITNFIKENYKKEGFPIQLNQLNSENTTYENLERLFGKFIDEQMANDKKKANNKGENAVMNPDYQILRIDSWEEAAKYGQFSCSKSRLCYTQNEDTWNDYQKEENTVYLILNKNWRNIPEEHGEDTPYDEYGLSMIFLFIDPYGDIAYSNTRWNHETEGNGPSNVDQSFSKEYISNLLNVNFDSTFKPIYKPIDTELTEKVKEQIKKGIPFDEIFDEIREFQEGFASVSLDGKWNFISEDGKLLSPERWFMGVSNFKDGFAVIESNQGLNWIGKNGKLLIPGKWFDDCQVFSEGFAVVEKDNKANWVDTNGNFLIPGEWLEFCSHFSEGFASLKDENGWNWIGKDGKILFPGKWFARCGSFKDGFAVIESNKGYNWIGKNGKLLVPREWFKWCVYFNEGFAPFETDKGWNWVGKDGKLLIPGKWFDFAKLFNKGFAECEIEGRNYFVDHQGQIYDENKKPISRLNENKMKIYINESQLKRILNKK